MKSNYLITGANRGLGLEFVKQYLEAGHHVIACCRQPDRADQLAQLKDQCSQNLQIHALDVGDTQSIQQFAQELGAQPIDVLINNAGILNRDEDIIGKLDASAWLQSFAVNTIGPVLLAQALLRNIQNSQRKLIITVSSRMGSIADNDSGRYYMYRSSKAAVNAAMKSLSVDLHEQSITVTLLHPGWVQTDMGGTGAAIEPTESVNDMRKIINNLSIADSGKFFDRSGSQLPW